MKKSITSFLVLSLFITVILCYVCTSCTDFSIKVDSLDITELKEYAENGNSDAQAELGIRYYLGFNGVNKNAVEAIKWLTKAQKQGNAYSVYWMGNCYYKGIGVEKDLAKANTLYKEAFESFKKMAKDGDIKALCYVGICHNDGKATKVNKKLAFEAFKVSAEKGYVRAQCNLGKRYLSGEGVKQSYTEAHKWFRQAAEEGDPIAQYNMGYCIFKSKTSKDSGKKV